MRDANGVELQIGDRVVWCTHDYGGSYLRTGTVTKVDKFLVHCKPDSDGKNVMIRYSCRIIVLSKGDMHENKTT